MDVSFDGELCKGLPAYYFVDKSEEYIIEDENGLITVTEEYKELLNQNKDE
jgi:hypothetical protein